MNKRLVVHQIASRLVQTALRQPRRGHAEPFVDGPVRFLVMNLHERGGSVRSNLLLASGLAQQHPVEALSLYLEEEEAFYPLPPGVASRVLDDRRPSKRPSWSQRLLSRGPSLLLHPHDRSIHHFTLWTDLQVLRALRRLEGGWLITTRPAIHLVAARFAPPSVRVIAREHDNYTRLTPALRRGLEDLAHGIDAVSVLTRADEADYERLLAEQGVHVFQAPNALEELSGTPAAVRDTTVLAAGRLNWQKGFDLLVAAMVPVAEQHPEWTLRIFGDGPRRDDLQAQVDELGLGDSVDFHPSTRHLGEEMARAGLFVLSSRFEGFGRVVIEALSKALPIVSFDCPRGPGEILTHGHDGLLVPDRDVDALSAAILRMIEDEGLRHRLAAAGSTTVGAYDLPTISTRWERALSSLSTSRSVAPGT